MKTIDRLIIKAKKKNGIERLSCGFISRSETQSGKWAARGDLWNGIPGSGIKSIYCGEYNSIDEAAEATLQELGQKYPNNKDIVILIDDVME